MTTPAIVAAAGPNERRTAAKSTATEATPSERLAAAGCSTRRARRARTDRPMTIVESGGLSIVMKLGGVERAEEPGRPALRRRLGGHRVVGVRVAADGQVGEVEERREGHDPDERRAGPRSARSRPAAHAEQATEGAGVPGGGIGAGAGDGAHAGTPVVVGRGSRRRGPAIQRAEEEEAADRGGERSRRPGRPARRAGRPRGPGRARTADGDRRDGEGDAERDEPADLVAEDAGAVAHGEREAPVGGRVADRGDEKGDGVGERRARRPSGARRRQRRRRRC